MSTNIPHQTLSIRDPGLGLAPSTANAFVYMGACEKGDANTIYALSNYGDVVDTLGQGPLSEAVCSYLANAGGPVYAVRLTSVAPGTPISTVTKTVVTAGSAGTVAVVGTPNDAYECRVFIMKDGTPGSAEFVYTLDNGYSISPQFVVPSGGDFTLDKTGLTLTFADDFKAGDVFTFTCQAPTYGSTELNDGIQALLASNLAFAALVLAGKFVDANTASAIAGPLGVHLESMFFQQRYVRAIMDVGADTPAVTAANFAGGTERICPVYGDCHAVSMKPFTGWGVPTRPFADPVAARCGSILISTDPARNASGPLKGVMSITHDEFRTELLDQHKFTTSRTWQGARGFYITNARLMSMPGSDFEFWQHGRLMDVACDVVTKAQFPFISTALPVTAEGTIAVFAAARWEATINGQLEAALLAPDNAEGSPGHVSAFSYKVDLTTNVLVSRNVKTRVAITPLGYAKSIETELGFAAGVGG